MTLREIIYNKNLSREELIKEVHSYLKDYGEVDAKRNDSYGHYQSNDYYLDGFNSRLRVSPNIDDDGYRKMVINELLGTLGVRKFNYNIIDDGDYQDEYGIYMADMKANKANAGYKFFQVDDDNGVVTRTESTVGDDGRLNVKEKYYVKENNSDDSKYIEIDWDGYSNIREKLKRTDRVLSIDEYNKIIEESKPVFKKTSEVQTEDNPSLDTKAIVKGASDLSRSLISSVPRNANNASNVEKGEGKNPRVINNGELGLNQVDVPGIKQKSTMFGMPISVVDYGYSILANKSYERTTDNKASENNKASSNVDVESNKTNTTPLDKPSLHIRTGVLATNPVQQKGQSIGEVDEGILYKNNSMYPDDGSAVDTEIALKNGKELILNGVPLPIIKTNPTPEKKTVTKPASSMDIATEVTRRAISNGALDEKEPNDEKEPKTTTMKPLSDIDKSVKAANTINLVNAGVGLATGLYGMSQVNKMKAPMPLTAPTITAEKVRDRGAQLAAASSGNINSQMSAVRNSLYRSGRQELLPSTIAPGVNAMNQASASIEQLRTDIDKVNTAAENRVKEVNAANKYQIGAFNQQVGMSFQQMKSGLMNQVLSSAGQNISTNLNGIIQNKFGAAMYQQGIQQRSKEMYQQMLLSGDPETREYAMRELKKIN